jgi:hypothetical protein
VPRHRAAEARIGPAGRAARRVMAGHRGGVPGTPQEPRIHPDGDADPGSRHRRGGGDVQHRERRAAPAPAVRRAGPPGHDRGAAPGWVRQHAVGQLHRSRSALALLCGDGLLRRLDRHSAGHRPAAPGPLGRGVAGFFQGVPSAAGDGPASGGGRTPPWHQSGGGSELRVLARCARVAPIAGRGSAQTLLGSPGRRGAASRIRFSGPDPDLVANGADGAERVAHFA